MLSSGTTIAPSRPPTSSLSLQVPTIFAGVLGALFAGSASAQRRPRLAMLGLPAAGVACYLALAAGAGLSSHAALPLTFVFESCRRPASGYVNARIGSERQATVLCMQVDD